MDGWLTTVESVPDISEFTSQVMGRLAEEIDPDPVDRLRTGPSAASAGDTACFCIVRLLHMQFAQAKTNHPGRNAPQER